MGFKIKFLQKSQIFTNIILSNTGNYINTFFAQIFKNFVLTIVFF